MELRGPDLLQHIDAPVPNTSSMKTWCVTAGVEELGHPDVNYTELELRLHPRPPRPTSVPDLTNALAAERPSHLTKSNEKPF